MGCRGIGLGRGSHQRGFDMHTIVNYLEIVIKVYHGEPWACLRYTLNNEVHESALYSLQEINNIIALWRMGKLQGSFTTGHELAKDFQFQIVG